MPKRSLVQYILSQWVTGCILSTKARAACSFVDTSVLLKYKINHFHNCSGTRMLENSVQPLVCVCVCVCVSVCVHVCVCVRMGMRACLCVHVRACVCECELLQRLIHYYSEGTQIFPITYIHAYINKKHIST